MKKLPKIAEITFKASHTMIVAHKPLAVCAEGLCENILSEKTEESITSLGLFGGSADVNKFYPDIRPEDWTPKPEDFIEPIFRGLSETILIWHGIPISFKKSGVLKASTSKAKGITINTNHDTETENAVGSVSKAVWQEASKVKGILVPAGINLILKIDAKSNPRLARGILMEPPSIHSNSVTVRFEHETSHPEMETDAFWNQLGNYDKKGNLIHVVVSKVISYKETSLVHHGADPYAQKITEEGGIQDPKYASTVYNFSEDNSKSFLNTNKTDMDFLTLLTSLGLTIEEVPDEAALVAHYKTLADNQIPENTDITALQASSAELVALKVVEENLTVDSLTALKDTQIGEGQSIITPEQTVILNAVEEAGEVAGLVANAALGVTYLDTIRKNAVIQFKITEGDSANEEIISSIMKSDLKAAKAFEAQYAAIVEDKFPMKCIKCGSDEISRATANKDKPEDGIKKPLSFNEARDKFAADSRRKASSLHESPTK